MCNKMTMQKHVSVHSKYFPLCHKVQQFYAINIFFNSAVVTRHHHTTEACILA